MKNEIRNKNNSYTKTALALDKESGKFVNKMLKKYRKELSADAIAHIIHNSTWASSTMNIALDSEESVKNKFA